MSSFDRQPNEPARAFAYFCVYRDLGPQGRSLPKVCQTCTVSVSRLKFLSEKHSWVSRCDQWDAYVQSTIDRAFLTEAAKRAKERAAAFTGLLEKSQAALQNVSMENVPLRDIAAAMKIACDGLRLEEGLATKHISMQVSDVRVVLSRLPAEVRGPLLQALASGMEAEGKGDFDGLAGLAGLAGLDSLGDEEDDDLDETDGPGGRR